MGIKASTGMVREGGKGMEGVISMITMLSISLNHLLLSKPVCCCWRSIRKQANALYIFSAIKTLHLKDQ